MGVSLPYPYPNLGEEPITWDPYALWRNLQFLASLIRTGETARVFFETFFLDATNPPTAALAGNCPVLDFSPTADQLAYIVSRVPPDMDVGAESTLIVTVTMSTSAAGDIVIEGARTNAAAGGNITSAGTAFGPTVFTPDTTAGEWTSHTVATIAKSTFANNDLVAIKLSRKGTHASDTHAGNMRLITLELEYVTRIGAA